MGRHQLERISAKEWRCTRCTWTWTRPPVSPCPGVPRYGWWPAVPEHLKTQTQLKEAGLKPKGGVKGCVAGRRDWYWLYDAAEAVPRRQVTEAQLRALAKGRETQERRRLEEERAELEAQLAEDEAAYEQQLAEREAAITWAREVLTRTDWVLLDTETTGLDADAQIVQLAVVSPTGQVLLTTLVKPSIPIPSEAAAIHGLTDELVASAPTFPDVYPQLVTLLAGRDVVAYNAAFDRSMVHAARRRYGLPRLGVRRWHCAMEQYSVWCGEWSAYGEDYRYQALPGGNHCAAGDCLATLHLLHVMARTGESGLH